MFILFLSLSLVIVSQVIFCFMWYKKVNIAWAVQTYKLSCMFSTFTPFKMQCFFMNNNLTNMLIARKLFFQQLPIDTHNTYSHTHIIFVGLKRQYILFFYDNRVIVSYVKRIYKSATNLLSRKCAELLFILVNIKCLYI